MLITATAILFFGLGGIAGLVLGINERTKLLSQINSLRFKIDNDIQVEEK